MDLGRFTNTSFVDDHAQSFILYALIMMHYYPVYNIDKQITNIDFKKFWQVREIFSKNSLFKSLSV